MEQLQNTINKAFEYRADITPRNVEAKLKECINAVLDMLNTGKLRIAEKVMTDGSPINGLKKPCYYLFV